MNKKSFKALLKLERFSSALLQVPFTLSDWTVLHNRGADKSWLPNKSWIPFRQVHAEDRDTGPRWGAATSPRRPDQETQCLLARSPLLKPRGCTSWSVLVVSDNNPTTQQGGARLSLTPFPKCSHAPGRLPRCHSHSRINRRACAFGTRQGLGVGGGWGKSPETWNCFKKTTTGLLFPTLRWSSSEMPETLPHPCWSHPWGTLSSFWVNAGWSPSCLCYTTAGLLAPDGVGSMWTLLAGRGRDASQWPASPPGVCGPGHPFPKAQSHQAGRTLAPLLQMTVQPFPRNCSPWLGVQLWESAKPT